MEMQQDVKLNSKEQRSERTLLALALVFVVLICIGIINQSGGVNQDGVLVPLFFLCGGLFFLLLGVNGLTKGQLIDKWTPYVLSAWLKAITIVLVKRAKDKQQDAWKMLAGVIALVIGLVCMTIALYDLYKHLLNMNLASVAGLTESYFLHLGDTQSLSANWLTRI